jgi:hypothetical protein
MLNPCFLCLLHVHNSKLKFRPQTYLRIDNDTKRIASYVPNFQGREKQRGHGDKTPLIPLLGTRFMSVTASHWVQTEIKNTIQRLLDRFFS